MRSYWKLKHVLLLQLLIGLLATGQSAKLLNSYLPASMQALAYYIDLLQYEPLSSTTAEPPFSAATDEEPMASSTSLPTTAVFGSSSKPSARPSSTTRRPAVGTTSGWWQPPSWWETPKRTTTTPRPAAAPTPAHGPALFAPGLAKKLPGTGTQKQQLEGQALFGEIIDNLDIYKLPLSLIHDIQTEPLHDEFTNDVESLDNFLRLYDDNYGRAAFDFEPSMDSWSSTSTAGKKRVPPTKPYVDFLLVYDLLKRDAKAANLSKYEGYSEELLQELFELSNASSTRQLHTLFQRMISRGDIQRSDVVARVQGIIKELGNPKSATAKALIYIPSMQFLP